MSRTVRLVHREAEGALLATQLLLAQGLQAMGPRPNKSVPARCSPRRILLVIREVILGKIGIRKKEEMHARLAKAIREDRKRTSSKVKRKWLGRGNHKTQKPPRFLTLTDHEKALVDKLLETTTQE
jgi:hypothetical protein